MESADHRPVVSPDTFKSGMRHLAAGVTIVATDHDGERAGLTATAVCSLSAEPPRLLACVGLSGHAFALIAESRRLSVNVLTRDQEGLARRFAGMDGSTGPERFEQGDWGSLRTGAPVLRDALVAFDCRLFEMLVTETHAVLIGDVCEVLVNPGRLPLLYMDGRWGTLASAMIG